MGNKEYSQQKYQTPEIQIGQRQINFFNQANRNFQQGRQFQQVQQNIHQNGNKKIQFSLNELLSDWQGWKYGNNQTSKQIDCSHLVQKIYEKKGIKYSYRTAQNFVDSPPDQFIEIDQNQAKIGDIITYNKNHMGIYIDSLRSFSSISGNNKGPAIGQHQWFGQCKRYYTLKK